MNSDLNIIWSKVQDLIKTEVSEISFETWIEPLKLVSIDNNIVNLLANSIFAKDVIENRYADLIIVAFNKVTQKQCEINIVLSEDIPKEVKQKAKIGETNNSSGLNPKYTFSTFVVGSNNRFAQAAAMGVAEMPGYKYNPYFIYGGVGLGKTHLMHAIGNQILEFNPNSNILYITSENFTTQLVNAIRDQSMDKFKEKFRNIDVLLIDDIQFIANKKSTQEEFFHTFNSLIDSGKQIVITSDRLPREIDLLEDRIKTRLECGLMVDIQSPDYETRFAILKKKTELDHILIDNEILSNIATKVDTNVRELEGILNKLVATASLTNTPITLEMSERAINEIIKSTNKVISAEYIQDVIGKYFNINSADLRGPKRSADVTFPRQIAMYLCRNVAQMSTPQIGSAFGNRDHSTVMHACSKIEKEIKENNNTKAIVESVKGILLSKN